MLQLISGAGEFVKPNWNAPLSLDQHERMLPVDAMSRGMFLNWLIDSTERECGQRPRNKGFTHFKEYPIADFVELARDCQRYAFPRMSMREALYRFGLDVFTMLAQTMVGRTIFGVAARDWRRTLELASKGYPVSIRPGAADVLEMNASSAVIGLRNVWSFPECYHVGIFEGAMRAFGLRGSVLVRQLSVCDADLLLRW